MAPTLVFTSGGGRLGNQLYNYANLLAFALEYDEFDVVDLAFVEYATDYTDETMDLVSPDAVSDDALLQTLVQILWGRGPQARLTDAYPLDRIRLRAVHRLATERADAQSVVTPTHTGSYLAGEHVDTFPLGNPENVETLRSRDLTLLAGYRFHDWSLVAKHRAAVKSRMQPGEPHRSAAEAYVASLESEYDLLVGALVRQTDYRTLNGGEYFFESEWYRRAFDAYAAQFPNREVGFLIASDERQPPGVFDAPRFNFATGEAVGPNHYLENFVELSLCDVVLSVPSTFSLNAAFLGDVPLVPLYEGVLDAGWERLDDPILDSLEHPAFDQE